MEHDTSLWTAPYHDEKYGEEKGASFKYFKEFIKMDTPRTLVHFHEVLTKKMTKSGRKRKPSLEIIYEYSSKWNWMFRAKAYDDWKRDVEDEEYQQQLLDIKKETLLDFKDRFALHRDLTQELKESQTMETNQKIYGFAKDSEGLKNDVSAFNEMKNDGATKLDATLDADVIADVQSENKTTATIYDLVDNQLEIEEDVTGEEGCSNNKEG